MSGWANGVFTRVHSWVSDKTNSLDITASRFDAEDDNFVDGLNNCMTVDGLNRATADIPPKTDNSYSLGTSALRWIKAFFSQGIVIKLSGGTSSGSLTSETLTANQTWTLPDLTDVLVPAPIGSVLAWPTDTAPTRFKLCDGSAISRTDFSALFTLIGTTFGTGDGSTTFNLPDLRGRVIAGTDDMGGTSATRLGSANTGGITVANAEAVGGTGGENSHGLTEAELASHNHTITISDPGHDHSITDPGHTHSTSPQQIVDTGAAIASLSGGSQSLNLGSATATSHATGISIQSHTTGITASSSDAGSTTSHNNVQPTMVMSWIIRAT